MPEIHSKAGTNFKNKNYEKTYAVTDHWSFVYHTKGAGLP